MARAPQSSDKRQDFRFVGRVIFYCHSERSEESVHVEEVTRRDSSPRPLVGVQNDKTPRN